MKNDLIDYSCPQPQHYNFVVCHKPSPCLNMFGDRCNVLYLSDCGVKGAIDVSNGYHSSRYGELPYWSWIAQNVRPEDWVTLHHYRRKARNIVGQGVAAPIQFGGSMAQQLAYYHSDVLAQAMLKTLTPVEQQMFCSLNFLYPYNIMELQASFLQNMWLPYVMDKITKLEMVLGRDYKPDSSFFEPKPDKRVDEWYQNRIYAFALERYNTLFWEQNKNALNGFLTINLLEENQKI